MPQPLKVEKESTKTLEIWWIFHREAWRRTIKPVVMRLKKLLGSRERMGVWEAGSLVSSEAEDKSTLDLMFADTFLRSLLSSRLFRSWLGRINSSFSAIFSSTSSSWFPQNSILPEKMARSNREWSQWCSFGDSAWRRGLYLSGLRATSKIWAVEKRARKESEKSSSQKSKRLREGGVCR